MNLRSLSALFAAVLLLSGCATGESQSDLDAGGMPPTPPGVISHAVAVLTPTDGSSVTGVVTFIQRGSSVSVTADVNGLEPNSEHAWHVHEYGDLTSRDGTAAGGHYNPEGHDHALPDEPVRHAGDFGNLRADATGHARIVLTVTNISINGSLNPVLGRAIIIHAGADDGGQPTGNAGSRIAQGVIGVARSG
ncbi:MAG: superoxide dismutase family protein [Planctomycetota bacterium]